MECTYWYCDREQDVGQDVERLVRVAQCLQCPSGPASALDSLVPLDPEIGTLKHDGEEASDCVKRHETCGHQLEL